MGKTVRKVIGAIAIVASFFVPGGVFISGGLLGTNYIAFSFAAILSTVGALSLTIGLAPEFGSGGGARQLAEKLPAPAEEVDPPWL